MATANPPASESTLGAEQAQNFATLRLVVLLAAQVLLVLGGVKIVTSVLVILTTTLLALLGVVEGALTGFLALILIKIGTDLRYAREMPQLAPTHFMNALDSWRDFCKTLLAIAVVVFLTAWARTAG